MRRAITTLREARDKGVREQVEAMRRSDTFEEVGTFASFSCQSDSLRLQPWQTAPLWVGDLAAALRKPFGDQRGDREAAEILQNYWPTASVGSSPIRSLRSNAQARNKNRAANWRGRRAALEGTC